MMSLAAESRVVRLVVVFALFGGVLFLTTGPVSASHEPAAIILVSSDTGGGPANDHSFQPSISADGTKIAYSSTASNLVAGDTNGFQDIFLYDEVAGTTTLVTTDTGGGPALGGFSAEPAISADGTKIAYRSRASNLVVGDTNGLEDVFRYDTSTGTTTMVTTDTGGGPTDGQSFAPAISADGTRIAYWSTASDLVAQATNTLGDVYVHDTVTGTTTLVSTAIGGGPANGMGSSGPAIFPDGTKVAYHSESSNLVTGDTNGFADVFVYDIATGTTTLITTDTGGGPTDGGSYSPSIPADATKIVYHSSASDLVVGDTNGTSDIFVYDMVAGPTTLITTDAGGGPSNAGTYSSVISADGTKIAFYSHASDLVVGDTNGTTDVFVYDIATGTTTLVTTDTGGGPTDGSSGNMDGPAIIADGTHIAFSSYASDLVVGDTNGRSDVFVGSIDYQPAVDPLVVTVPENATAGVLGTIEATDVESLTFTITAGDSAGLFAVDATTGVVSLLGTLDYEIATQHVFTVTVSEGTHNVETTVTVNVTDVGGLLDVVADPNADSFGDDDGSVFETNIEWLAAAGVTKGCNPPDNSMFCPDANVTRGQMAAFLVRALGYTDDGGGDLFVDDDGSIFESQIDRLGTAGVTRGCNPPLNDLFCPDANVTRGQMAAFLVRALGYTDDGGGNLFVDDDGSIFEDQIDKLATAGVTRGCNPPVNDQFCPGSNVTRGQMAAFLHRALG